MRALIAFAALAVGVVGGILATSPPQPIGADAPGDVFAVGRALTVMERLVGDETPHPVGTAANAAVRDRLLAELRGLGLEPEMQRRFACNLRFELCGEVVNVLATLPGPDDGPVLVLSAHYDSAPAGPGVSDDMVGVVAVLEAARHLIAEGPTTNRVALLLSDGEEAGLLGARAFLAHPLAQEVALVVNVEARGSRGASLLFETSADNAWLIRAYAREARRPMTSSLLYQVYELLPNDTDLTEYKSAGMAGVNFAYVGGVQHYHTPLDDLAHLSLASFQHQGENVLAAARAYAAADLGAMPEGGAIFTYVAPGLVASAPLSWALPLAALATLALVLAFLQARRRGMVTVAGWGLGFVAALVAVAFAGLLATGAVGLLTLLRPEAQPWYANPLATRVAVWSLAMAAVSLGTAVVARPASRWGLALGAWTLWALVTLAVAVMLPSAAPELLLALLIAAVLHLATSFIGLDSPLYSSAASFLSAAFAAYLLMPLALDLESGLGLGLAGAIAVVVGLVVATAMPLLAARRPRPAARPAYLWLAMATLCAAFGLGAALLMPAYTQESPRQVTFTHLEEWESGEPELARWLAATEPGGPLSLELSNAADWQVPAALVPWTGTRYHHAEAPRVGDVPPQVEVVSDTEAGGERVLRLRLTTTAPPLRTVLRLPPEAGVAEVRFEGTPSAWDFRRASGLRPHTIVCVGETCAGRVVELVLRGEAPFEVVYAEMLTGLPEAGAPMGDARGDAAVPSHLGDVSLRVHRFSLP